MVVKRVQALFALLVVLSFLSYVLIYNSLQYSSQQSYVLANQRDFIRIGNQTTKIAQLINPDAYNVQLQQVAKLALSIQSQIYNGTKKMKAVRQRSMHFQFRNQVLKLFKTKRDPASNDMSRVFEIGKYKPATLLILEHFLRPNFKVIDAGGWYGHFPIVEAALLDHNKGGMVYTFEPNELVFQFLQNAIATNDFEKKIKGYNYALYNTNGLQDFSMFQYSLYSAISELYTKPTEQKIYLITNNFLSTVTKVKTITLDHFFDKMILSEINLLRLDVTFSELYVLQGAKNLIKRSPNLVIIFQ